VDESLKECFARPNGAVLQTRLDLMAHACQFILVRRFGCFLTDGDQQILAAGPKVGDRGGEAFDALAAPVSLSVPATSGASFALGVKNPWPARWLTTAGLGLPTGLETTRRLN
jgi:hypothetical protein